MRALILNKLVLGLILFMSVPVLIGSVYADTRFVSDMLIVGLRTSPRTDAEIIKTLRTDTPVEVLEEEGGYARVRTEEGDEGWIGSQYITSSTPKPVIIAALKRDVAQLEATVEKLETERDSLQAEFRAAKNAHDASIKALQQEARQNSEEASGKAREVELLTEKYNTLLYQSENLAQLVQERDRIQASNNNLRASVQKLTKDMEQLQMENVRLSRNSSLWWFLSGSGVFLIGLAIGKFSRKKKYY